jgi:hypothetical protein
MKMVPLTSVMAVYSDGDEKGWMAEFDYLCTKHKRRIAGLKRSIAKRGIIKPILLGADGRVWDGHHRMCAAYLLGLHTIPVVFSGEDVGSHRWLKWRPRKKNTSYNEN